jgi:hypothetical protein
MQHTHHSTSKQARLSSSKGNITTVQESVLPTQWCTFYQLLLEVVTEEEKKDQGDVRGKFLAFSFTLD